MPSFPHPGPAVPEEEKENNSAFGALPYGGHSCLLCVRPAPCGECWQLSQSFSCPWVLLTLTPQSPGLLMLTPSSSLAMGKEIWGL